MVNLFLFNFLFALFLLSPLNQGGDTSAIIHQYFDESGFTAELEIRCTVGDQIKVQRVNGETVLYETSLTAEGDPLYAKFLRFTFRPSIGAGSVKVFVNNVEIPVGSRFEPAIPNTYRYNVVDGPFILNYVKFHLRYSNNVEIRRISDSEVIKRYETTVPNTVLNDRFQLPGRAEDYLVYVDGAPSILDKLSNGWGIGDTRSYFYPVQYLPIIATE